MNEELDEAAEITDGAAGAPEGTPAANPTTDDVEKMYKELGIKRSAPTSKPKERPKAATVRTKDTAADDDADTKSGRKDEERGKGKSKNASDSDEDGAAGDDTDAKGAKVSKTAGKVSGEPEESDEGVRGAKSGTEGDSQRGSEEDAEQGDDRTGQDADESRDASEEGEDDEGKRPGKSNPKIEQRFQRLTSEVKERDELIEKLQRELQETTQAKEQAKIAQEDPEYTIDDFRKVQNERGEVIELDEERAELAWRRWKDGYEQRTEERNAEANRQAALKQAQNDYSEKIMRQSVEAYDTLAGLMDEYPQLVSTSGKFDADFAAVAMPIINDAIQYQPGTEPGNEEGIKPIIIGLKINPKRILDGMKKIGEAKRSLPLNGVNDNVESRSNVNVQRSRSSDPTVHAANELYKELGIDKRI